MSDCSAEIKKSDGEIAKCVRPGGHQGFHVSPPGDNVAWMNQNEFESAIRGDAGDTSAVNASRILEILGLEPTDSNVEQLVVMLDALMVYAERNARHADTWQDSGWRGALFDIRKKVDRLWNEFMVSDSPPEDLDSALDAINFLCFFIRARRTNINGTWRWK